MNPYEFMMPRLEGRDLENNPAPYVELVKKGVAGFILFGGRLEAVKEGIAELQRHAVMPLVIASDLERGLGQQVEGGTVFPSAMAFGKALLNGMSQKVLKRAFSAIATEARHAGINMIFAPVLDVNSNPDNPIIATRAFGEGPGIVAKLGAAMIEEFQRKGVSACGKHFPGHGDTAVDSHLAMPEINKGIKELEDCELVPFRAAAQAGARAMMLGHLKVPAIEPSGLPMTVSARAVEFLRNGIGFKGLIITDAMNMAGLSMPEERASELALRAGVNIILHPSEPDGIARHLAKSGVKSDSERLFAVRNRMKMLPERGTPYFEGHRKLADEIALKAISIEGDLKKIENPALIILSDEPDALAPLLEEIKEKRIPYKINPEGDLPPGDILAVTYSTPRAWRPPSEQLKENIRRVAERDPQWISFGNPYLIYKEKNKILAYSDSELVQREVARRFL